VPQDFYREVLARLPLAEAVLSLWQFVCDDQHLDLLYDRHRGGTYQKKITCNRSVGSNRWKARGARNF
jgi:hypothetical protein